LFIVVAANQGQGLASKQYLTVAGMERGKNRKRKKKRFVFNCGAAENITLKGCQDSPTNVNLPNDILPKICV
jgi:hypothetical protein